MDDAVLRSMIVSAPRTCDGACPMDTFSSHSPPLPTAASRANQRGARFKQHHVPQQPYMQHAESMPAGCSFQSRPIDDDTLSEDGLMSPMSTAQSAAPYVVMQPTSPVYHARQAKQPQPAQVLTLRPSSAACPSARDLPLIAQPMQGATPYQRTSVDRSSKYRQDMRMAREGSCAMDRWVLGQVLGCVDC